MSRRVNSREYAALAIAAAVLSVLMACGGQSSPTSEAKAAEPPPLPADVSAVEAVVKATPAPGAAGAPEVSAIVSDDKLTATGEFVSPSRSEVAPKIPGRVASVYVDDGARVQRGEPIFAMETDYLRLDVQRARAELARTSAALAEAQRDFDRKKELRQKDSIPQATYDRSQGAFEQMRAGRAAAQSGVAMAQQRLSDATVRAPLTGVVEERKIDVGEHLAEGGVAFVIMQTAPLKLRFQVPEKYLSRIQRGLQVVATVDPYPGEKFEGRIKTVGGVIDPATRTMFAEAEFPNSDGRLRPGLFARVNLTLN